jgi:uncharacterized peroxidase-related enzyme
MISLPIHTVATAPEGARPALGQVQSALGFVPNLYGTFAGSPEVLQGYLGLSATLDRGTLTASERELLHIAISTENSCEYCVAAHSTLAGMKRIDPETVEAVRTGRVLRDSKLNALIGLTREAIRQRGAVSDATVTQFLEAGYTRAQLLEVIGHIGLKTIANYINNLAHTPLDQAFQPQAWNASELQEMVS